MPDLIKSPKLCTMDWRERYKRNTVSAEEAARAIRPGDWVTISVTPMPTKLMDALAARRDELKNVHLHMLAPHYDPGWLQPDWDDAFDITIVNYLGDVCRPVYDQKLIDFQPVLFSNEIKPFDDKRAERRPINFFLTVISPPDEHGFCSFGGELWHKRRLAQVADKVMVEVDEEQIRTYGTNYIHASEIDVFIKHTPPGMSKEEGEKFIDQAQDSETQAELRRISPFMSDRQRREALLALIGAGLSEIKGWGRWSGWLEPPDQAKSIGDYVSEMIKDGDTVQIGVGTPGVYLPSLGVFDDKKDLGWYSEMSAPGVLTLIEKGIVNGSRKSFHKGKALFTGLMGSTPEEVVFAHENPLIELHDADYILNISNVVANDNQVSINNAISIDLTGQINSETLFGGRLFNGTGGQPELHIGAVLSRGGRAITLLTSTAMGGLVSKIVPQHEEGAVVTVPRTFADIVVTEYGVAGLLGKSIRERAQELINVAHPDFRAALKKAAAKLFYP